MPALLGEPRGLGGDAAREVAASPIFGRMRELIGPLPFLLRAWDARSAGEVAMCPGARARVGALWLEHLPAGTQEGRLFRPTFGGSSFAVAFASAITSATAQMQL